MKSFFIVGDVHGCFYTLQKLLLQWKPKQQQLIFVGDIIDHGNFSPQVAQLVQDLQKKHPDTVLIRGNHEQQFMQHCLESFDEDWYGKSGERTFSQYLVEGRPIDPDAEWFKNLPLVFEHPNFIVSHAGISDSENPFDPNNKEGVVWQRNETKKLPQLQVFGHTPKEDALYDANVHAINIDTGAYKCNKLTALLLDKNGNISNIISVPTANEDMPEKKEECLL
ncbi:metallophosphoesterase family protein [Pelobium manganitolerans]|uniref:metallophosphoesterase family protein n=1 Tax=Pelobium manganitolerans TaxID=1842495 RepID=UPI003FA3BC6F